MGLYSKITKVKKPYYRIGVQHYIYYNRQVHKIGILYYLYRRHFSRRYSTGLYKRSVFKT